MKEQSLDNLWLAQTLFDLGAVQFGNFTVSESAVSSPVFVNPKVLISNPTALRVASKLMQQEINLAQSLRRPKVHPFAVVACGAVTFGTAVIIFFSLGRAFIPTLDERGQVAELRVNERAARNVCRQSIRANRFF